MTSLPNPTLVYEFGRTKRLPQSLTFSRASPATYVDSSGYIQYASNNTARFTHDTVTGDSEGLLIEESRTNLYTYSEKFDNAVWSKGNLSIVANWVLAPDGTYTGTKIVETTTASTNHWLSQVASITSGQTYTTSIFVKAGERTKCIFGLDSTYFGGSGHYILFDASAGTASVFLGTPTYSITAYRNGWYKISVTATATVTGSGSGAGSIQLHNGTSNSYTGDGTSGLYVWGYQLEVGSFVTTYIPSNDTFTSRASSATYFDSTDSILKTTPTNLLTYSQDFTNAAWSKSNVLAFGSTGSLANITLAPDGTLTASKIVEDTTTNPHMVRQAFSQVAGEYYTFSVYVKSAERTHTVILVYTGTNYVALNPVNLSDRTGVLQLSGLTAGTASYSVTNAGFGWSKIAVSFTATNTGSYFAEVRCSNGSTSNYTGDGISGLYIWGAQANIGPLQTYSTTTTTALTTGGTRPNYNAYSKVNNGLLAEPAATNLITYSQAIDNAYWTKFSCTATANQGTAPDGSYTADLLAINTTSSVEHYFEVIVSTGSNNTSTASWFVKMGTQRYVRISSYSSPTSGNNAWVAFDLASGSVLTSAVANATQRYSIVPYGNGWYRISQTITFNSSSDTSRYFRLHFCNNVGANSYVGAVTDNFYVWGCQLEMGNLTSYIPTYGSTATRSADVISSAVTTRQADVCSIDVGTWFNQPEGTLFTTSKVNNVTSGTFPRVVQIQGINHNTDRMITYYSSDNVTVANTIMANNATTQLSSTTITAGSSISSVMAYKSNDAAVSYNGGTVVTDNTVTLISNPTRMTIGNNANVQNFLNGTINRLYYWPKRLTNTDIQNLSGIDQ